MEENMRKHGLEMNESKGQIVIYRAKGNNIQLKVKLEQETVWLTQKQIAQLFGTQRPAITKHLDNIFSAKELQENSVCSILEHTASDGKTYKTKFYNLDAIISVGYRVNSARATQFRVWATGIIKRYLVDGYTINEERLKKAQAKYLELQKAVGLIGNVLEIADLSHEARGIAEVISGYARALDILDDFDHKRLALPAGTRTGKYRITYENAQEIIDTLKRKFPGSVLVGQEHDQGFKSSLGAVYQTFGGKDVYLTVEEKAAHLLYFVTKNHSFVDGNKRIAAVLFVCFLDKNGLLLDKAGRPRLDTSALVALTLLIAASKPSEKDVMIRVILNLLAR